MGKPYYEDDTCYKYVDEEGIAQVIYKTKDSELIKNLFPNQPERSKREDLDNGFYFPPPWNIYEHPEKTEGWIEFQKAMKKDPDYYLRCGALNSMET